MLQCPSDVTSNLTSYGGPTNYMANKGAGIIWLDPTVTNVGFPEQNGVMYYQSRVKMKDIVDGTTNTAAFSERVIADGNNAVVSPIADVFFSPAFPVSPGRCGRAMQRCWISPTWPTSFLCLWGGSWIDGQHTYLHVSTPNTRSCGFFVSLRATMPPSSYRWKAASIMLLC